MRLLTNRRIATGGHSSSGLRGGVHRVHDDQAGQSIAFTQDRNPEIGERHSIAETIESIETLVGPHHESVDTKKRWKRVFLAIFDFNAER